MLALGTNPYTIEFFAYITTHSDGHALAANDQDGLVVVINSTKTSLNKYNVGDVIATNAGLSTNVWHHIAIVRTSTAANQTILYIDGSQAAVGTDSNNWTVTANPRIGGNVASQRITGYISNLRIVSSALYSGTNITVPTAPFSSSQTGTLFLACQSNTLVDSTNTYTIASVTGNPLLTEFNPLGRTFTTGVNYSATTHGSSGYFNGSSNNHLSTTAGTGSGFDFGTGEFTVEAWIYPYSVSSLQGIFGTHVGGNNWWQFRLNTTTLEMWGGDSTGTAYTGNTAIPANTWTHIAASRSGTSVYVSVNGSVVARSIGAASTFPANTNLTVGNLYSTPSNYWFNGHITGVRILKGTALYKSNFVPQLQPPQAVANTQLLLNFNNAGVVDYSGKNVLETVSDSRSVTSTKKSLLDATGSVYFDGTNDYLRSSLPASYWNLFGDFTVEFWINPIGNSQSGNVYYDIIGTSNNQAYIGSGQTGWVIAWSAIYGLRFGWQNSNTWSIDQSLHSTTPTFNTWAHIAVVRRGSTITGYINGIAGSTPITSSTNLTSSLYSLHIGSGAGHQNFTLNGYLQDVRITTIARYTGTFTPPVRTFSATVRDVGHKQWVVNNLSVASGAGNDSLVDTPTNYGTDIGLGGEVRGNYCIWNPLNATGASTANGNLEATLTGNASYSPQIRGTLAPISGKWYWENTVTVDGNQSHWLGVIAASARADIRLDNSNALSQVVYARYDGQKIVNGTMSAYGASYTTGDIIGIALDLDLSTITFYKNNVSQGTLSLPTSGIAYVPVFWYSTANTGASGTVAANFGQRPFNYTAPSGYKALCTQNLPTPSIVKPNTAFDTALYTGNGTSITVSGLNFSPDLVWMKARSGAFQHGIFDRVRGNGLGLVSNSTAVETSYAAGAFTNDGFTNTTDYNGSGVTYAAWSWDENPVAGVDIALATANASAVVTYNHSLGVSPAFVISKSRSATVPWLVYHKSLGANQYLLLNTSDASTTLNGVYTASSSQFTITSQTANATYVSYLFAEMPGFSAFGSYTGNGSTDGPFVYTGFRPAWIMIKRSDSVENWNLYDNKRNRYNIADLELYPNLTNSEGTTADRDFLSNGFKIRSNNIGRNASGGTYIYAAFAENPFKYSLAR